jgi:peptidyl-prolyl cis-trans isomerase SurA
MEIFSIMKRVMLAGMLGLAVSGCAQSRSKMPASQPVGMDPVPSIHDTINRGTGDRALQQSALRDPEDPRWSGRPATAGQAAGRPAPYPAQASGPVASSARTDAKEATPQPLPPLAGVTPQPAAAPAAGGEGSQSPEMPAAPPERQPANPALPPAESAPADPPAEALPSVEETKSSSAPAAAAPASPAAPESAASVAPPGPPTGASPHAAAPAGDPLLGPNPDLMPAMDGLDGATGRKASAPGSAAKSESGPAPGELPLEAPPQPPVDPRPAAGDLSTAPGSKPAPAPPKAGSSDNKSPGTAALQPAPRNDPAVRLASATSTGAATLAVDRNWKEAGRAAARVGDEVITLHDLVLNVKEQLKKNPPGRDLNRRELNMVAKSVLAGLIERTLIAQEAKRELKNPKQLDRLYEAADKYWREEELPPMMRRYMVDNETQLRQKFTETGRSLEAIHQSYRQEFLVQVFIQQKLADRQKVELPEMLKYYNEHMNDKSFHRPATITWRELVIEKGRYPDPADARNKAEGLLARLKRGEDFATLARTESEGPSRIRAEGGLMETSPGSNAVESVNAALASLPLNAISPILEGPTSLHIVRVEARREAGPATFMEVQDQIRRRITTEKIVKARSTFLAKLRRDTPISTIFDGTESDPNAPDAQ